MLITLARVHVAIDLKNVWGKAKLSDHYQLMYASSLLHFAIVFQALHGSCFPKLRALLLDMDFND